MALKADRMPKGAAERVWQKAPLTPDSPDAEARAMAGSADLMTLLRETDERAREPGGTISHDELLARNPLSPEAEAEGAALAAAWERDEQEATKEAASRRKRGRPAATYNGRLLVRVPTSVHRALAERAAAEHTTINQLVLSYVSHGLGVDAAQE